MKLWKCRAGIHPDARARSAGVAIARGAEENTSRASAPARCGAGPPAATAYSVPPSTAKMVDPSVLTMSGSSMPGSWLLVVEKDVPLAVEPAFSTAEGARGLARSGVGEVIDDSDKG